MPGWKKIAISARFLPKIVLITFVIICDSHKKSHFFLLFTFPDKEKCPECCGKDNTHLLSHIWQNAALVSAAVTGFYPHPIAL